MGGLGGLEGLEKWKGWNGGKVEGLESVQLCVSRKITRFTL